MAGCHTYPKAARLRRRVEFLVVQRKGRRRHTPQFIVIEKHTAAGSMIRIGITVSSRVGNAVVRNRLKRLVREVFRLKRTALVSPADIVVIAKPGSAQLTNAQVATEIAGALDLTAAG